MIRLANKFDNKAIKKILVSFALTQDNNFSNDSKKWDFDYIENQLTKIYAGMGFVLIDDLESGFICAVKAPSFWFPNRYALYEMMWYSDSKKVAVELLNAYIEKGKEMIKTEEIVELHFSAFSDVDFSKYGAKKFTNDWVI